MEGKIWFRNDLYELPYDLCSDLFSRNDKLKQLSKSIKMLVNKKVSCLIEAEVELSNRENECCAML